jgi:maleamate amidohydrolase
MPPRDALARWRGIIPDDELAIFRLTHRRPRIPIHGRLALLVVDLTYDFTGDPGLEQLESQRDFPSSCGPTAWRAIPHIRRLIRAARRQRLPIVYTRAPSWANPLAESTWSRSRSSHPLRQTTESRRRGNEIPAVIAPAANDLVIEKTKASAFFGTPLHSYLTDLGIDCLLVSGCATSGCVRGTVLDASYLNYGVNVVEECVFDRSLTSHRVNLFDMDMKYANVISLAEALRALKDIPDRSSGEAVGDLSRDDRDARLLAPLEEAAPQQ